MVQELMLCFLDTLVSIGLNSLLPRHLCLGSGGGGGVRGLSYMSVLFFSVNWVMQRLQYRVKRQNSQAEVGVCRYACLRGEEGRAKRCLVRLSEGSFLLLFFWRVCQKKTLAMIIVAINGPVAAFLRDNSAACEKIHKFRRRSSCWE